jgi:hypothetical protein
MRNYNLAFDVCWTVHRQLCGGEKNQPDATQLFIDLIIHSTCFEHYYANLQELDTIQMVTACGTKHFVAGRWSGTGL